MLLSREDRPKNPRNALFFFTWNSGISWKWYRDEILMKSIFKTQHFRRKPKKNFFTQARKGYEHWNLHFTTWKKGCFSDWLFMTIDWNMTNCLQQLKKPTPIFSGFKDFDDKRKGPSETLKPASNSFRKVWLLSDLFSRIDD